MEWDIVVVGAGIVGLATAMQLLEQHPGMRLLVVDKERRVARHQTGHNSGVIHRGIYYAPDSLKAKLCVAGAHRLIEFCDEHQIPYRLVGKLIAAKSEAELPALRELQRRGEANGVAGLRWLDAREIRDVEPHAAGVAALHSPTSGIVDYTAVAKAYAQIVRRRGGDIRLRTPVTSIRERASHVELQAGAERIRARLAVTCTGLHSDRLVSRTTRAEAERLRIVPFRGSYHRLSSERSGLVRGLIYPVPDPRLPFLGAHATPQMDGSVWLGPNAVLAFAREGYRLSSISGRDLIQTLTFSGFWRLAARYWRTGSAEMWRDVSTRAFTQSLRPYLPDLSHRDIVGRTSGVRAQAVAPDGSLVDDFVVTTGDHTVHVQNAPSPAATSSLAIADVVAERVSEQLARDPG